MRIRLLLLVLAVIFLTVVYSGCASSPETSKVTSEGANNSNNDHKVLDEDFDITPYKTEITLKEKSSKNFHGQSDVWYDYPDEPIDFYHEKTIITTTDGYRVRVTSTDNLGQADSLKSEVYSKTNQKQVYIIFDPPFYRIEVGDFIDISAARDLRFKLNQLGYNQAIVVNEKVNVYKQIPD